jgi:hypothetical protein
LKGLSLENTRRGKAIRSLETQLADDYINNQYTKQKETQAQANKYNLKTKQKKNMNIFFNLNKFFFQNN